MKINTINTGAGTDSVLVINNGVIKKIIQTEGPIILARGTASNIATLDIDLTGWYTNYNYFEIILSSIQPATDNVTLQMQVSSDGINYDSSPDNYGWAYDWSIAGANGQQGNTSDTKMDISQNCGNTTGYSSNAVINIFNPGSSTFRPLFTGTASTISYPGDVASIRFGGQRKNPQVTRAVRFLFSSGNISTATYKVIGYKN